ncbi:MAG: IS4 family transposase, partial [Armatimonadia bacterium]
DSQLRTLERLRAFLGLCCVVAWRLLWITYSAREGGDQPATVAFLDIEWQAAYCALHHGQAPPKETPTLREVTRWVAQLGGFLARKGDGEPGAKTLWRGMNRLHDIVLGALLFAPHLLDVGNV